MVQEQMDAKESLGEILRSFIHPLVIKVLSLRRNFKLEVIGEIPKNQQFIFIANHYCIDDIPTVGKLLAVMCIHWSVMRTVVHKMVWRLI